MAVHVFLEQLAHSFVTYKLALAIYLYKDQIMSHCSC